MTAQSMVDRTNPATTLKVGDEPDQTTVSPDLLADQAGFLRNRARLLGNDVLTVQHEIADLHRSTLEPAIEARAREVGKRPLHDLLDELARQGFSWRAVAQLAGVSVPAVRKWRLGQSEATGANRHRLARVVALCEVLEQEHLISDVASWLEMPLNEGSAITTFDLLNTNRFAMVVELAGGHRSAREILDEIDPGWDRREAEFEIVDGADGEPVIRARTIDDGA